MAAGDWYLKTFSPWRVSVADTTTSPPPPPVTTWAVCSMCTYAGVTLSSITLLCFNLGFWTLRQELICCKALRLVLGTAVFLPLNFQVYLECTRNGTFLLVENGKMHSPFQNALLWLSQQPREERTSQQRGTCKGPVVNAPPGLAPVKKSGYWKILDESVSQSTFNLWAVRCTPPTQPLFFSFNPAAPRSW